MRMPIHIGMLSLVCISIATLGCKSSSRVRVQSLEWSPSIRHMLLLSSVMIERSVAVCRPMAFVSRERQSRPVVGRCR